MGEACCEEESGTQVCSQVNLICGEGTNECEECGSAIGQSCCNDTNGNQIVTNIANTTCDGGGNVAPCGGSGQLPCCSQIQPGGSCMQATCTPAGPPGLAVMDSNGTIITSGTMSIIAPGYFSSKCVECGGENQIPCDSVNPEDKGCGEGFVFNSETNLCIKPIIIEACGECEQGDLTKVCSLDGSITCTQLTTPSGLVPGVWNKLYPDPIFYCPPSSGSCGKWGYTLAWDEDWMTIENCSSDGDMQVDVKKCLATGENGRSTEAPISLCPGEQPRQETFCCDSPPCCEEGVHCEWNRSSGPEEDSACSFVCNTETLTETLNCQDTTCSNHNTTRDKTLHCVPEGGGWTSYTCSGCIGSNICCFNGLCVNDPNQCSSPITWKHFQTPPSGCSSTYTPPCGGYAESCCSSSSRSICNSNLSCSGSGGCNCSGVTIPLTCPGNTINAGTVVQCSTQYETNTDSCSYEHIPDHACMGGFANRWEICGGISSGSN